MFIKAVPLFLIAELIDMCTKHWSLPIHIVQRKDWQKSNLRVINLSLLATAVSLLLLGQLQIRKVTKNKENTSYLAILYKILILISKIYCLIGRVVSKLQRKR
jgi:hypothetical protein